MFVPVSQVPVWPPAIVGQSAAVQQALLGMHVAPPGQRFVLLAHVKSQLVPLQVGVPFVGDEQA
jgi:hypothetical protein